MKRWQFFQVSSNGVVTKESRLSDFLDLAGDIPPKNRQQKEQRRMERGTEDNQKAGAVGEGCSAHLFFPPDYLKSLG